MRFAWLGGSARRCALLVAAMLCVVSLSASAEVVVVVSAHSPIAGLSEGEIADIFLGKLARLSDGTAVRPLDQAEGSPAREAFYRKFTGKSQSQLKAFWSKVIFTGRGRPPRALANDTEVIRTLRENPDAIGYVDRKSIDTSVRVLR